jgi:hypothetical protein
MSITLGQLAQKFANAANKVTPLKNQKLRTIGQLGVGIMKSEIQGFHAVDTGTMLNSTTMEMSGDSVLIGPTVLYAPYVALGTSRMAARPFHITAARKLQAQLKDPITARELGL